MAYATQEEVFGVVEELLTGLFRDFGRGWQVSSPFLRIPYAEALSLYGSDKPDLLNPLTIVDVSKLFVRSEFQMFKSIVVKGGVARGLAVPDVSTQPRSFFDDMQKFVGDLGAPGLAWIVRNTEGFSGPVANAMGPSLAQELASNLTAALPGSPEEFPQGAALFLLAGDEAQAVRWAGALRLELGHRLQLAETEVYRFAWITDFPLYEMEEESGEIVFSHNPFSMPQGGLEALQDLPPLGGACLAVRHRLQRHRTVQWSRAQPSARHHGPRLRDRRLPGRAYGKRVRRHAARLPQRLSTPCRDCARH